MVFPLQRHYFSKIRSASFVHFWYLTSCKQIEKKLVCSFWIQTQTDRHVEKDDYYRPHLLNSGSNKPREDMIGLIKSCNPKLVFKNFPVKALELTFSSSRSQSQIKSKDINNIKSKSTGAIVRTHVWTIYNFCSPASIQKQRFQIQQLSFMNYVAKSGWKRSIVHKDLNLNSISLFCQCYIR